MTPYTRRARIALTMLTCAIGAGLGGAPHVPFRDSKLTRVLKDSLTGNSFTCLLACLHPAPENVEECGATLQFAVRRKRCLVILSSFSFPACCRWL